MLGNRDILQKVDICEKTNIMKMREKEHIKYYKFHKLQSRNLKYL